MPLTTTSASFVEDSHRFTSNPGSLAYFDLDRLTLETLFDPKMLYPLAGLPIRWTESMLVVFMPG
jgi:hypothetical protein